MASGLHVRFCSERICEMFIVTSYFPLLNPLCWGMKRLGKSTLAFWEKDGNSSERRAGRGEGGSLVMSCDTGAALKTKLSCPPADFNQLYYELIKPQVCYCLDCQTEMEREREEQRGSEIEDTEKMSEILRKRVGAGRGRGNKDKHREITEEEGGEEKHGQREWKRGSKDESEERRWRK